METIWDVTTDEVRPRRLYIAARTWDELTYVLAADIGIVDSEGLGVHSIEELQGLVFDDDDELERLYQERESLEGRNAYDGAAYYAGFHDWLDESTVELIDGRTGVIL